jgi:hypothetical protein
VVIIDFKTQALLNSSSQPFFAKNPLSSSPKG